MESSTTYSDAAGTVRDCKPKISPFSAKKFIVHIITMCAKIVAFFYSATTLGSSFENTTEFSLVPAYFSGATFPEPKIEAFGLYSTLISTEKFSAENWQAEMTPEIRMLQTDTYLQPSEKVSIAFPQRVGVNAWQMSSQDKSVSTANLEKLDVTFQNDKTQFVVGRKPVSLGVLSVFPVWNKFSRPFVTSLGPLRIVSQDQVLLRHQFEAFSLQALDIEQPAPNSSAKILEGAWFGSGIEAHALASQWWTKTVGGIAVSADILSTTLRFESLHIQDEGWQIGFGGERAFTSTWSGLVEFLYSQNGAFKKDLEIDDAPSLFRPLLAAWYGFGKLTYKWSDLLTLDFGWLSNFVDGSEIFNPKFNYSLSNDMELGLEGRFPMGAGDSELNRMNLPEQVLTSFRYVF